MTSRPLTVVEDVSRHLALYTHPNAPYRSSVIRNRYSMPVSERIDIYLGTIAPKVGQFEERVSGEYHVLTLTRPNSWHSVRLFWTVDWIFKMWYVNFQAPIGRTPRGILVRDCALDIIVGSDMTWSWKDKDEFKELISRGFFTDRQILSIEDEADRIVKAIEDNASPFSDGWEKWRPNLSWPVPEVPGDWYVLG